jgi:hypothetical protein
MFHRIANRLGLFDEENPLVRATACKTADFSRDTFALD